MASQRVDKRRLWGRALTPDQFITKWKSVELTERAAAQSHFIDLCQLLGEPTPTDADPKGEWYAFERGATKTTGGEGWADVWKKGHFGWEYKGKRKDLNAAFAQLQQYALALENPPLLVVCDMDQFRIHTNWTNTVSQTYPFKLEDLRDAKVRETLKWVFSDPERLRPGKTRQTLTEEAAAEFAKLAQRLRDRGYEPETVAHFVNRLVFCMFAEDVDLLPNGMFKRMLEHAANSPGQFQELATDLFGAMKSGGRVGFEQVAWFNGGLFNDDQALPLDADDLKIALNAARLDWAEIDPSILGTLFERGLDPDKRSQLGAHYTDREKIMMIVNPVIVEPWLAQWEAAKGKIAASVEKSHSAKSPSARTKAHDQAVTDYRLFLNELRAFRVLDPACGSGNFLYLALLALKDIEHRVSIEAEAMGLQREFSQVGPAAVKGIEINPYAAELARVSVWIGEIQWMRRNGFGVSDRPILKPLDNIECRDAILNEDGSEASWPNASVIIGNPPYLGAKLMYRRLGRPYTLRLRAAFDGRLGGFTDLVCYWFEKAREKMLTGGVVRTGFVATNSIAKNTNLPVMRRIAGELTIYDAWNDEEWVIDGAAVRVALICFEKGASAPSVVRRNGVIVPRINADLTSGIDMAAAQKLKENRNVSWVGIQKSGPFDVFGEVARAWLTLPSNPNGLSNSAVLKPFCNGDDLTGRPRDRWLIDMPLNRTEAEVSLFEAPFKHLRTAPYDPPEEVRPLPLVRATARDENPRNRWWEFYWPRPEMRQLIEKLPRYIVTPMTSEHRIFVWLRYPVLPDNNLIVFTRSDDTFFGVVHSRFHEIWTTAHGNRMGQGNQRRYNNSTVFDTFPFPLSLIPSRTAVSYADAPEATRIGAAAAHLDSLRQAWLNPPELIRAQPEIAPGFPERLFPIDDEAEEVLRKRTLTNLYNESPTWLLSAHADLDAAVAAAYGWPADISEEEALARLFELNQERAANEKAGE